MFSARNRTRSLREEAEGVQNGSVKRVTQVSSPVVKWTFAGGSSLDGKAKKCHHGKASMLYLRQLKGGFLLRVGRQTKWIEEAATRVKSLLGVKLGIPLELNVSNHQDFNPY